MNFIQFLRPDGRQRTVKIDRAEEIEKLATELQDAGHRFEIEELMTGTISMTVEIEGDDGEEITRAHKICANGPAVPINIDAMTKEAYADWQEVAACGPVEAT